MANEEKPVSTDLTQFMRDQQAQGVRGFVVGEFHDGAVLPDVLRAQVDAWKAQGVSTLYLEHVPSDRNDVLQSALNGNEADQKKIRADLELGFGSNHTAAQNRYDMMMAAHAAGIRVIGVDTPHNDMYKMRDFLKWTPASDSAPVDPTRVEVGSAHMADTIRQQDDGKPFVALVGAAHTSVEGRPDLIELGGATPGDDGGVEARLRKAGIKSISIDQELYDSYGKPNGTTQIYKNSGWSDFTVVMPKEEYGEFVSDEGLVKFGRLERLEEKTRQLAARNGGASVVLDQQVRSLNAAFNGCASKQELAEKAEAVVKATPAALEQITDPREWAYVGVYVVRLNRSFAPDSVDTTVEQNDATCKPDTAASWKRSPSGGSQMNN